jgi:hypothetical protein
MKEELGDEREEQKQEKQNLEERRGTGRNR